MKKFNIFNVFTILLPLFFIMIFITSSSKEDSAIKKLTTTNSSSAPKNFNFCRLSSDYEISQQNSNFEIIYLTITIKNNNYSFNNTKNIKSIIAISKSGSTSSWFKVLTVHRDSLIPNPN